MFGFAAATLVATAALCPSDCSLNGACVSGRCECDGGWKGVACDQLSVGPARRGGGLHNASLASWGGNAIFEGGKYHLFAAAMLNECGLEAWGTNSYVLRAEADTPDGPFEPRARVLGPFAHNPTVRHLPDGSVLLYLIGSGNSSSPPRDCRGKSVLPQLPLEGPAPGHILSLIHISEPTRPY